MNIQKNDGMVFSILRIYNYLQCLLLNLERF